MLGMLLHLYTLDHEAKYQFMPNQPVLMTINPSKESLFGQGTVLVTVFGPQNLNIRSDSGKQSKPYEP